jgi:hypothetical protein
MLVEALALCPKMRALPAEHMSETGMSPRGQRMIADHVQSCAVCRRRALALLGPQGALGALRLASTFVALMPPDDVLGIVRRELARSVPHDHGDTEEPSDWRGGWPPPMVLPRSSADVLWGDRWPHRVLGWAPRHPITAAAVILTQTPGPLMRVVADPDGVVLWRGGTRRV